ncbi:MAG: ATP synthase F1 subunit delta [Chloroflexota bacterium]
MTNSRMVSVLTRRALEIAIRHHQLERWRVELTGLSRIPPAMVAELCRFRRNTSRLDKAQDGKEHESYLPEVVEFVCALVAEGRGHLLSSVAEEFGRECDAYTGRMRAHVVAAIPLDEDTIYRIERRLSDLTGRPTAVDVHVDPDVVGGLVIKVGDRVVDRSVHARLESLRNALLSAAQLS